MANTKIDSSIKKRMGWNVADMANSFIDNLAPVKFEESEVFWMQVVTMEEDYFELLVNRMLNWVPRWAESSAQHSARPLTLTMAYLLFFHDFRYVRAINKGLVSKLCTSPAEGLDAGSKLCLKEINDFVSSQSQIETAVMSAVEPVDCLAVEISDIDGGRRIIKFSLDAPKSFYQLLLKKRLRERADQENAKTIALEALCRELNSILNASSVEDNDIFYQRALLCLNLAEEVSRATLPVASQQLLELYKAIESFFFWPALVSANVLRLSNVIIAEVALTGSGLLETMLQRQKCLYIHIKTPVFGGCRFVEKRKLLTTPLYYFTDISSKILIVLMHLKKIDTPALEYFITDEMPIKSILMAIIFVLNYNGGVTETDIENLQWLTKSQIYSVFQSILNISFELSERIKESNAKFSDFLQSKTFSALKRSKMLGVKKSIYETAKLNISKPSDQLTFLSRVEKFPADFKPDLPPFGHLLIQHYYSVKDASISFNEISLKYSGIVRDTRPTAKIIILGGKTALNAAINHYFAHFPVSPAIQTPANFEFYLIPTERFDLADYIAERDPIYRRYVYSVFTESFILPHCELDNETVNIAKAHGEIQSVGSFYRQSVESFVSGATALAMVSVFRIEIWRSDEASCDEVVPFVDSVKILFPKFGVIRNFTVYPIDMTGSILPPEPLDVQNLSQIEVINTPALDSDAGLADPCDDFLVLKIKCDDEILVKKVYRIDISMEENTSIDMIHPAKLFNITKVKILPAEYVNERGKLTKMRFPLRVWGLIQ